MAASDARPVPRKNTAFRFYFSLRNLSTGALITTWTGADSEVSLDGAAFADCTNEATEIGTTGCGYIDLTAAEMNADAVLYKLTVTNTNAETLVITFFPEESGDYRADAVMISGDATAADNAESFFDGTGYAGTNNVIPTVTTATNVTTVNGLAAGVITAASIAADAITDAKVASDVTIASVTGAVGSVTGNLGGNVVGSVASVTAAVTVGTINANVITASAIATDAVTEIQSGLATAANLATVAGYLDTEIAAILVIAQKLDTAMVLDGAVYQFTANALELGPSGGGGTSDWTADERTAIRTILGVPTSGTTPEVPSAGALKVIDDLLDTEIAALTTAVADLPTNAELATALGTSDDATLAAIAALNNVSAAQVVSAMGTGTFLTGIPWNAAWDAEVQSECTDALAAYDGPTNAEMVAAFTEIKGATWSSSTDTLEAIRDRGDAAWVTGSGSSASPSGGTGGPSTAAALRGTTDLTPVQFTFPTASLADADFTTANKRIDGGTSAAITGAISFLYTVNGEHYYQIAYNAADRPTAAGIVTYLISDGTSTVSFDLQVIAISDGGLAVLPGRDRAVADANASTITVKLGEIITIARGVIDANGQPMDLSGFDNLQFVVQDARGLDLATVDHADITISGADDDTYSFVTPSAMTAKLGVFDFSLNQVGGAQIVGGKWIVLRRAVAD